MEDPLRSLPYTVGVCPWLSGATLWSSRTAQWRVLLTGLWQSGQHKSLGFPGDWQKSNIKGWGNLLTLNLPFSCDRDTGVLTLKRYDLYCWTISWEGKCLIQLMGEVKVSNLDRYPVTRTFLMGTVVASILFKIIISNLGSRIDCLLSSFMGDIKMSSHSSAKMNALFHQRQSYSMQQCMLGADWQESSFA